MAETRIWICPALCGCEIAMNAEWPDAPSIDDKGRLVSYRHPKPFTAVALKIVGVCRSHDALRKVGVDVDPWPDRPGYLKRPIPKASEAESLYVRLWGVHAQSLTLNTCGCVVHQIVNELAGTVKVIGHPSHTKKCSHHLGDDDQHSTAIGENVRKNKLIAKLLSEPTLTQVDPHDPDAVVFVKGAEPKVYFDDKRQLRVDLARVKDRSIHAKIAAFDAKVVVD